VARLGLPLRLPSQSDLALLRAYAWPGNVREPATVIERAAPLGSGNRRECATARWTAHGAARLLAINPHTLRARKRNLGVVTAQHRPRDE
jgi:transcriptional regulator with GAF, ATPase, and Fis domain